MSDEHAVRVRRLTLTLRFLVPVGVVLGLLGLVSIGLGGPLFWIVFVVNAGLLYLIWRLDREIVRAGGRSLWDERGRYRGFKK